MEATVRKRELWETPPFVPGSLGPSYLTQLAEAEKHWSEGNSYDRC